MLTLDDLGILGVMLDCTTLEYILDVSVLFFGEFVVAPYFGFGAYL